jgi:predicted nucleotidyltransferase
MPNDAIPLREIRVFFSEREIGMLQHGIINEILRALTNSLNLYKVILFGSFASGTAERDSDIDLIVVTDDDFMPRTYQENMQNYLSVSAVLRDIKARVPIDLIVHTKPMHDEFIHLGSMFSKDVMKKGEVLYEKNN